MTIGAGTMYSLWSKVCNHPNLKNIVNDFNDKELTIRIEMGIVPVGSTSWCMLEFKRYTLLSDCKKECLEHLHIAPTHSDRCSKCNTVYYIDSRMSEKVCKGCGHSITILIDHECDYISRTRYNGNRRHHYDPAEHFAQTISDFSCTGSRRVPIEVYAYCRNVLGIGLHVTSHNVFLTLQMGGYSAYYQYKYEITNRLRGKPEFTISCRELDAIKDVYRRYRQEFIPFQQAHYIGKYSKNGKPRIYWPMRYILKKMVEEIKRDDLKMFIRGVCDKQKLKLYDKYWKLLKDFIDSTRPMRNTTDLSLLANRLSLSRQV